MPRQHPGERRRAALAFAAFAAVAAASYAEYLLWALAGTDNEWLPVLLVTLALAAGGAAITSAVAGRLPAPLALAAGLVLPCAPYVVHLVRKLGYHEDDQWLIGVAAAVPLALLAGLVLSRRRAVTVVALCGLLAFAASGVQRYATRPAVAPPDSDELPDIVLLVMDTTRPDHLSLYGYPRPTTPRLESFARTAQVYEQAWSTSSWTPPSHATMFTGLLPAEHGVTVPMPGGREPFPPELVTLPRVLERYGYRTAGFVANRILRVEGWEAIFQTYRTELYDLNHSYVHLANRVTRGPENRQQVQYRTGHLLARARRWWASQAGGPRLLFINLLDAHWPYEPLPGDDRFVDGPRPPVPSQTNQRLTALRTSYQPAPFHVQPGLSDAERRHLTGLYDGELLGMDREIGRFLDWLEARGELDRTIVVVTSDHGERLGERGLVGHCVVQDPHVLWVPLLVRHPPSLAPARIDRRVQLDGLPGHVLHLAGIEAPAVMARNALHLQDRELFVAQRRRAHLDLTEIANVAPPTFEPDRFDGDSVFIAGERFCYELSVDDGAPSGGRLIDFSSDPDLARDVAERHPEQAAALRKAAEALPRYGAEASAELDEATREALRSLGYAR